jgi:hypothetical protein
MRIRFSTSNPQDMHEPVLRHYCEIPQHLQTHSFACSTQRPRLRCHEPLAHKRRKVFQLNW